MNEPYTDRELRRIQREDHRSPTTLRFLATIAHLQERVKKVEQYERTLKFYANPKNWAEDSWGVRSILHGYIGRGKKRGGYGKPELPAALALNQEVVKLR